MYSTSKNCRRRREEYLASSRDVLIERWLKSIRDSSRRLLQFYVIAEIGKIPLINTQLQLGEILMATAKTVSTVSRPNV